MISPDTAPPPQIYDTEQAEVDSLTQQIATHNEQARRHKQQADELANKLAALDPSRRLQYQDPDLSSEQTCTFEICGGLANQRIALIQGILACMILNLTVVLPELNLMGIQNAATGYSEERVMVPFDQFYDVPRLQKWLPNARFAQLSAAARKQMVPATTVAQRWRFIKAEGSPDIFFHTWATGRETKYHVMDCVICPLNQADQPLSTYSGLQIDVCGKIEYVDSAIMNMIANGKQNGIYGIFSCSMLLLPSDGSHAPIKEMTLPQSMKDKNFKASYLARIGLELGLEWNRKIRIEAKAHKMGWSHNSPKPKHIVFDCAFFGLDLTPSGHHEAKLFAPSRPSFPETTLVNNFWFIHTQALQFNAALVSKAQHIIKKLKSKGRYVALHLRVEEDWVAHCRMWPGDNCMTHTDDLSEVLKAKGIPFGTSVYLATGLTHKEMLKHVSVQRLAANYKIFTKDTLLHFTSKELDFSKEREILAAIDWIVCDESDTFVGNSVSTFSALRLLGLQHQILPSKLQPLSPRQLEQAETSFHYNGGIIPLAGILAIK